MNALKVLDPKVADTKELPRYKVPSIKLSKRVNQVTPQKMPPINLYQVYLIILMCI